MSTSLAQKTYTYILSHILQNEYVPGQIISRREIAQSLGISISPVTEAVILLENEGLLETFARKGTQVRLVTSEDFAAHQILREAMECAAIKLLAGEPIQQKLPMLKALAKEVDDSTWGPFEYFQADKNFHQALIDMCGNSRVSEEYRRISTLGLYVTLAHIRQDVPSNEDAPHSRLITQLSTATPEEAAALIQRHIRCGKGSVPLSIPKGSKNA